MDWGKVGLFAGGVLFGTAGIKALSSKDAKKAYTHVTACALRSKDYVMENVDRIRENADDILADAKEINEKRYREEVVENIPEIPEDTTDFTEE